MRMQEALGSATRPSLTEISYVSHMGVHEACRPGQCMRTLQPAEQRRAFQPQLQTPLLLIWLLIWLLIQMRPGSSPGSLGASGSGARSGSMDRWIGRDRWIETDSSAGVSCSQTKLDATCLGVGVGVGLKLGLG